MIAEHAPINNITFQLELPRQQVVVIGKQVAMTGKYHVVYRDTRCNSDQLYSFIFSIFTYR